MNCMKCGVEIPETQVFCDHCLAVMEQCPVRAGVHVHLPKRARTVEQSKKPVKKKRTLSPEEQISALKLKVLRPRLVAVILAFVICLIGSFLALKLYEGYSSPDLTGRNYTIDTSMNN